MEKELVGKLTNMPFFTLGALRSQSKKSVLPQIKYYKKTGKIVGLKRGVYVFQDFIERIKYQGQFESYLEFLGTNLLLPSYVSLEYALSKYSILSESPFTLTFITTKATRAFENSLAVFSYSNIKKGLFCGFEFVQKGDFEIARATKAKALFDFLYLGVKKWRGLTVAAVKELRLNLGELGNSDWKEFAEYISLADSEKMTELFNLLVDVGKTS